jgi:hypothetical protein
MDDGSVSDELLDELWRLHELSTPPPWRSSIEGRDHSSGDSAIFTGLDDARGDDLFVMTYGRPADANDLDLIAAARTYLPRLISEIRRLRAVAEE